MSGVMGGLMSAMMGERVAEGFTGILAGLKKRAESA
jgi:hypothetical protein